MMEDRKPSSRDFTPKALYKALETALDALWFYANPDSYFAIGFLPDRPCGDFINDFDKNNEAFSETGCVQGAKPGKHARRALLKVRKILKEGSTWQTTKRGEKPKLL